MNAMTSVRLKSVQERVAEPLKVMDKAVPTHDHYPLYAEYHRGDLKVEPRVHWVNGWKVEYLAFADAATAHLPPVVILGGAFQNFNSYKYCIDPLLTTGPVILVDLPALGSNDQLVNTVTGVRSLDLDIHDLSAILTQWIEAIDLPKVSMMGMSLGSVIAANYAHANPERMSRLVLMGVMQETRKSWRMLIQEALDLLHENRMVEFGQAMILYLVNHARIKETRMSPTARKLFFQQMSNFGENERLRYEINASRLLRIKHVPSPTCPTLVATGQYDSFTLPFENAKFALDCPDMQFALVKNADHVPQLQKRRETLELFTTFLRGDAIDGLDGIQPMTRDEIRQMDRRSEQRVKLVQPTCRMTHRTKADFAVTVNVVDMSYFGLKIDAGSEIQAARLLAEPRDMSLHLSYVDVSGETVDLPIECLIFAQEGQYLRAMFKHGNFEVSDELLHLLESDAVQQAELHPC